jgi:serine/threonine protein kinase
VTAAWRGRPGDRLGPWTLEEPLGQGGFSEVWRARRSPRDPAFALKLVTHPEHVAQLRAEAESLARVRGPGIVSVHELDLLHDPPYLVMDLVPGGNLRQREARRRAPDVVRALETIEPLLEVLARVHREGVVHGDLKPENILLERDGSLRVADFGLSRRIAQRTATLSVSLSLEDARLAGTLDYMAPEQRAGQKPTAKSDVYACGVLLYELLTGVRPQGVFKLPGALSAAVPPAVDRLVACALAQDPRHRFATAGAMLRFLRAHPREEWKSLASAHRHLSGLLSGGSVASLAEPPLFLFSLALVVGPWWFMLFGFVGQEVVQPARAFLGSLLGVVATLAAYALVRPGLVARRGEMVRLQARLEQQIQTGRRWSGEEPDDDDDGLVRLTTLSPAGEDLRARVSRAQAGLEIRVRPRPPSSPT